MAMARAPTPCTSGSSSRLASTKSKNKDADPSKIIWANPDHEVYRKQMVEECAEMLLTHGIDAKVKPEVEIRAGNCSKSATITFKKGESDANKFFQVAMKDAYKFTRNNGTEVTMKIFKDQSSVDQRKGQLINMVSKFLLERKPDLGDDLIKEKFKCRLMFDYKCLIKINVDENTLAHSIVHFDEELLGKIGTSIDKIKDHLKQKTAGWLG